MRNRRTITLIALAFVLSFATYLMVTTLVRAFNGPPTGCVPPGCEGAVGANSAENLSVGTSTPAANTKFLIVASSTDSSNYALQVLQPDATPIFAVRNDGFVGIGTAAPAAELHVNLSAATQANPLIKLTDPSRTVTAMINSDNVGDALNGLYVGTVSQHPILFGTNNTQRVIIDSSGQVGIGTTTPSYKLDVSGQIRSSSGGFVFPDGTTQATAANAVNVHIGGWAVFDGSTATLIAGYNVSSTIGRSGAGYYYISWLNPFPNTNYAVLCTASNSRCERPTTGTYTDHVYIFTTQGGSTNSLQDDPLISVMAFY